MTFGTACEHGWFKRCDRCESEREIARLRARADRLEAAIRDAPHESVCASYYFRIVNGITEVYPCDCWKRAALEDKE